jgi:hypothetical protein
MGEQQSIARAWQIATVREAQKEVHRKTGFLQRNIRPGAITASSAKVDARTPYAATGEFGSRPHVIRPRNAKVLAWGGPRRLTGRLRKGGKATHFARIVHHPGTKPYPYLMPAARKALGDIKELLVKRWNDAA